MVVPKKIRTLTNHKLIIAPILSLLLTACPGKLDHQVQDPMSCMAPYPDKYITYRIDPSFSESHEYLIVEAIRLWMKSTGHRVAFERLMDYEPEAVAKLNFVKVTDRSEAKSSLPPSRADWVGLYVAEHKTIYILANDLDSNAQFLSIAVHEIGHALIEHGHIDQDLHGISCMTPSVDPMCVEEDSLSKFDRKLYCKHNVCLCDK